MDKLLEIVKLSVHYHSGEKIVKVVENVDLTVNEGEIVGLVGESGCGKSTLALSVMRLIDAPGKIYGEVRLRGKNLLNVSEEEMQKVRGEDVSMVFQDPFSSLNPVIKVGEQIAEVFRFHKGSSRADAWKQAVKALQMVGIKEPERRAKDYPHQFSGGMRQRVSVAMAYALSPKLLIADEPTTALDVTMQKAILEILRELKTTMLFISHNIAVVASLCSRIYIMQAGRIVEEGSSMEIIRNPKDPYTAKLVASFKEIK